MEVETGSLDHKLVRANTRPQIRARVTAWDNSERSKAVCRRHPIGKRYHLEWSDVAQHFPASERRHPDTIRHVSPCVRIVNSHDHHSVPSGRAHSVSAVR